MSTKAQQIRLAIIGGRDFTNYEYMKNSLAKLAQDVTIIQVVSGGARGADSLGEQWANEQNIPINIFPAQWEKYGRSAGFRRNKDIINNCDMVAAFWDGQSRGTENSIQLAKEQRKPVRIFKY